MKKLYNKKLSVLSLLTIPGVLSMPVFFGSHLFLLPILMYIIGSFSFGALVGYLLCITSDK